MPKTATIPFHYETGRKATTTETDRGDLLVEAWALRFDEEADREEDHWSEEFGLIRTAMDRFVRGNAPVCWHHDFRTVLGKCLSSHYVPGIGIRVKGRIDYQEPSSPWRHHYEAVRRGSAAQVSMGGRFKRDGHKLVDADFLELSVCGTSIGRKTSLTVLAQKALQVPEGKALSAAGNVIGADPEIASLSRDVDRLTGQALALHTLRLTQKLRERIA